MVTGPLSAREMLLRSIIYKRFQKAGTSIVFAVPCYAITLGMEN